MAIVKDPHEAIYAGMPYSAMTHVQVDAVLSRHEIGFALARLAGERVSAVSQAPAVDERAPGPRRGLAQRRGRDGRGGRRPLEMSGEAIR